MRHNARGLSLLELMLAMGLLYLCASFLMSMFVVGSRAPERMNEQAIADVLAQQKMDELVSKDLTIVVYADSGTFGPDRPDYRFDLSTAPAGFDPLVTLVTLDVLGPSGARTTLHALRPPNPAPSAETILDAAFGCTACHRIPGMASSWPDDSMAPPLDKSSLEAAAGRAGQALDQYIDQSVRDPASYIDNPSYTADMVGYGFEDAAYFTDSDLETVVRFIQDQ